MWDVEMAVLAALSKSCLADDLSKIFENDCINTLRQLDSIKCLSDPISIVNKEAFLPRESKTVLQQVKFCHNKHTMQHLPKIKHYHLPRQ